MTNSADPDQLASSTDLNLHCLLRQGMLYSARGVKHWARLTIPAILFGNEDIEPDHIHIAGDNVFFTLAKKS